MQDPFENQRALDRLTGEVRALLAARHGEVVESMRQRHCPDQDFEGACERFLPQIAQHIGYPNAATLDEVINHDVLNRRWAIELGVRGRWSAETTLIQSDQQEGVEANLREGEDPDTDRVSVTTAKLAAASERLAGHDRKMDEMASSLAAKAATLAPIVGLLPNSPVRDVFQRLDEVSGGELLAAFVHDLLPAIREARGLEHDPPPEELLEMVLALFDNL